MRAAARRDGRRIRVAIRLTDGALEQHLWSERIEAEADSLFALHDDLSAQIVARLAPAIRLLETGRIRHKPEESLTAYELYLRAAAVCRRGPQGNANALRLLQRAVEHDPELSVAYALAARCYHLQRLMGWTLPHDPRLQDGVRLAHRALEIDGDNSEALWLSGLAIANLDGSLQDGLSLVERSLAINPNNASAWIASCFVHTNLGHTATAIEHFERAQRVNPMDGSQHSQWHAAATAYFVAGRIEEADLATDKALAQVSGYPGALRLKIATSGLLGRIDAAHRAARRLMAVNPEVTIANVRQYWRLWPSTADAVAAMTDGWRRAGMPEG